MFTSLLIDIIWPTRDVVTIDIPINVGEYTLPDGSTTSGVPVEFMICRKRDWK